MWLSLTRVSRWGTLTETQKPWRVDAFSIESYGPLLEHKTTPCQIQMISGDVATVTAELADLDRALNDLRVTAQKAE